MSKIDVSELIEAGTNMADLLDTDEQRAAISAWNNALANYYEALSRYADDSDQAADDTPPIFRNMIVTPNYRDRSIGDFLMRPVDSDESAAVSAGKYIECQGVKFVQNMDESSEAFGCHIVAVCDVVIVLNDIPAVDEPTEIIYVPEGLRKFRSRTSSDYVESVRRMYLNGANSAIRVIR